MEKIDLQARMAEMQAVSQCLRFSDGPPGWEEKYIIEPDEIPWWKIVERVERNKACHRQGLRMWKRLHPGYFAEAQRKFSGEHPGYFAEAFDKFCRNHPGAPAERQRRFRENHPGYYNESARRFNRTPKGKANTAKSAAKRRERSTDSTLYAARVYLLHDLQEPCAKCGALYDITFVIDHIIALCLDGTDDWDNYQPLCIPCHREKSKVDMCKYREVLRRENGVSESTDKERAQDANPEPFFVS